MNVTVSVLHITVYCKCLELLAHLNRAHDSNVGGDLVLGGARRKVRLHGAHILFLFDVLVHLFWWGGIKST